MRKFALCLIFLFGIACPVHIYGDIYEAGSMKKLNDTIVTVKSSDYSYRQVFQSENYSFELPPGGYTLVVERFESGTLRHSFNESIFLSGNETRIDFVLVPHYPDGDSINNFGESLSGTILIISVAFVVLLAVIILLKKESTTPTFAKQKIETQDSKPETATAIAQTIELDEDAKAVLGAIVANEGRATQKELREILNFSDAKMSLIIAELTHYGKIRKFKRGRGNILVANNEQMKMTKI